jgi:hypothetical protein
MISGLLTTEVKAATRGKACMEEIFVPTCRYSLDLGAYASAQRPR